MLSLFQAEVIHSLGEQIGTQLAHAENVGAEGNVEESLKLMEEVDRLKKEKSTVEVRRYVYMVISNRCFVNCLVALEHHGDVSAILLYCQPFCFRRICYALPAHNTALLQIIRQRSVAVKTN